MRSEFPATTTTNDNDSYFFKAAEGGVLKPLFGVLKAEFVFLGGGGG